MDTATFTSVRSVAVPVTDQDETKALLMSLGLTEVFDTEIQPGFRWIELTPPGGGAHVAVISATDSVPAGIDTGIRFETSDARAAHAAVSAAGMKVEELLDWDTAPLMFSCFDRDGNRFYVMEAQ